MEKKYDIAVLGGGPGGYIAALRGAQLDSKVVMIEKHKIGGTCMNYGCIPAKYLLHQTKMVTEIWSNKNLSGPVDKIKCNWEKVQSERESVIQRLVKGIEFILKKNGVEIIKGEARLNNDKSIDILTEEGKTKLQAEKIILATGSRPSDLPFISADKHKIITSRDALELSQIPEKLLIIGAGAIGLEMGTIFKRLGTKVIVLEIMPFILQGSDQETAKRLERLLIRKGLDIYTEMNIKEKIIEKDRISLKGFCLKDDKDFQFDGNIVLLAAGRKPNTEFIDKKISESIVDKQGFVKVNEKMETDISGIYAIGDLVGGKLLAHKASHEGITAAENASGLENRQTKCLPMAVFTEPEFASVGLTEEEAKEKNINYQVGSFSLQASGRALTMKKPEGKVKLLIDDKDKIIGAHILSPHASEIIAEATLAIDKGLDISDLFSSVHIHPTLSEAVMEAGLKTKDRAFHILNS